MDKTSDNIKLLTSLHKLSGEQHSQQWILSTHIWLPFDDFTHCKVRFIADNNRWLLCFTICKISPSSPILFVTYHFSKKINSLTLRGDTNVISKNREGGYNSVNCSVWRQHGGVHGGGAYRGRCSRGGGEGEAQPDGADGGAEEDPTT